MWSCNEAIKCDPHADNDVSQGLLLSLGKMLLAICKYRHTPLPKQPSKIGHVLGLTFAARVFTTTSDPHEAIIERGKKQIRCWVGNAFASNVGA